MKKILTSLVLTTLWVLQLSAQEQTPLSLWLSQSMQEGEVVGHGADINDARSEAFGLLYDKLPLEIDSTSLLAELQAEDTTITVDRRKAWIEAAIARETWAAEDTLYQDSVYWVRLKSDDEQLSAFEEYLQTNCIKSGSEYLARARYCYEKGDLLSAALEYSKGLTAMIPCMHRALPSESLDNEDIAKHLYVQYLEVFKGIKLSAVYEQVPIVMGEDIPVPLKFRVMANGKPVIHMPVQGWISSGRMKVGDMTDAQGYVTMHIIQAPSKAGEQAGIILHSNLQSMLEDNFARPAQSALLSGISESAQTLLVPFSPIPTFYVSIDSADIAHHDSIAVMLTRREMIEVSDSATADIICHINYQDERGFPTKHGVYTLTATTAQLSIQVVERQTNHPLASYAVPELTFSHPDARTPDMVRRRAMELMMRQVFDEMPALMKFVNYDKRKVVYDSIVK